MLKDDIIEKVAKEAKLTKKAAKEAVESTFKSVQSAINKGEKVVLKEPNPKTGSPLPAMKTIGFIASKAWKKIVR